jgi:ATP-dependent RNA helicase DDX56/DBP9
VVREALSGKDVLARARTGSGKTAAYALPMLHLLLGDKRRSVESKGTAGLVLVPTKELSRQAGRNIREIARFCSRDIEVVDVSGGKLLKAQKAALRSHPDIVVGTPSQVRAHIDAGAIDLSKSLKMLVIDEADLVFSYGYEEDVVALLAKLPPIRQNLLMSATLGSEVEALKKLVLRRPVVLKLKVRPISHSLRALLAALQPAR